ncbi:MAG: dipeptidase [Candidatus Carbobacillus altaicus]|nr:dipeptidase [Candidatus Carbobacillus altaicus]
MSTTLKDALQYVRTHRNAHLDGLKTFLTFPSVSALSQHKKDVQKTAEFLADEMRRIGLEHIQIFPTDGHPIVYGDWLHAEGKPTALIYGHYDVQPVDPEALWESPPFQPEIRGGKLYARGASDDKGQVWMHLKALEAYLQTNGSLPINVKVLIEGEEEIGSPHLPPFVEQNAERLQSDLVVISDSTLLGPGQPAICYGLRGLAAMEITVKGAKSDLHSGLYGGVVQNPLQALAHILASFHDDDGRVAIPHFYDDVRPLSEEEKRAWQTIAPDDKQWAEELGVPTLFGEKGYTPLERNWARPTLEINGMGGGFQGEGIKTVLPNEARAKISCRLVPDQDPDHILSLIEDHIKQLNLPGVRVSCQRFDTGRPFLTPYDHPAIQAAKEAYEAAYGKEAVFIRMGGSIPIVEDFSRILGVPVALMGFGLPTENFHAPNEHFHLENYDKGIDTLLYYWDTLSKA